MEDALVPEIKGGDTILSDNVLILVLMEDALVLAWKELQLSIMLGLNPCVNGRCTRTRIFGQKPQKYLSLNPCFNGRCTRTESK